MSGLDYRDKEVLSGTLCPFTLQIVNMDSKACGESSRFGQSVWSRKLERHLECIKISSRSEYSYIQIHCLLSTRWMTFHRFDESESGHKAIVKVLLGGRHKEKQ